MGGLAFSETLNFFFKSDQDDYQILKMIYDISLSIIYFENDNKNWAYVAAYIFWYFWHDTLNCLKCYSRVLHYGPPIKYTFLSNHYIHKSLCGLCFWAPDPLINRTQLKSLQNKGQMNFYECCDSTKKYI